MYQVIPRTQLDKGDTTGQYLILWGDHLLNVKFDFYLFI